MWSMCLERYVLFEKGLRKKNKNEFGLLKTRSVVWNNFGTI